MGIIKMPNFSGSDSKYRPCLQEFYADWAPEKLGTLDDTLIKWEGRVRRQCARLWHAHARAADRACALPLRVQEKQLFAKLGKKYKKQVNINKCK